MLPEKIKTSGRSAGPRGLSENVERMMEERRRK
jgi:hypothetical protein